MTRNCPRRCCRQTGRATRRVSYAANCIGRSSNWPKSIWIRYWGKTRFDTSLSSRMYCSASAAGLTPRRLRWLQLDEVLAVVLELFDGLVDIGQRLVSALLHKALVHFRLPAQRQLFQGTDVQITIVKIGFETRHILDHEAAVLSDG